MANFKYDKNFIENMAKEFMDLLCEHHCANATTVYFNGTRYHGCWGGENKDYFIKQDVSIHPMEITEYTVSNNILAFSTEGDLYDILYGGYPKWFEDFCEKYNVYAEPATSWFYHFCPNSEWDEWETDDYEVEEETYLFLGSEELNKLPYLRAIADFWYDLARIYGNKGSCVLGAGFRFVYENKKYKLSSCSPYYASLSWEHDVDLIKKCLEHIGCTNIHYDWGNMD